MTHSLPRWLAALAVAALPVLVPQPARASLVLAMELDELTRRSDQVVVGEVVEVTTTWDERHERIWSTVELTVAETWKGATPGTGRLRIVQPGGSVGDVEMKVHGLPGFSVGERAVLFLQARKDGAKVHHALVGLGQGRRPLNVDPATGRWFAEPPDLSAAVIVDKGSFRPAPAQPALPLETLRERVRQLVPPRGR